MQRETQKKYAIRKTLLGVGSVLIGQVLIGGQLDVYAAQIEPVPAEFVQNESIERPVDLQEDAVLFEGPSQGADESEAVGESLRGTSTEKSETNDVLDQSSIDDTNLAETPDKAIDGSEALLSKLAFNEALPEEEKQITLFATLTPSEDTLNENITLKTEKEHEYEKDYIGYEENHRIYIDYDGPDVIEDTWLKVETNRYDDYGRLIIFDTGNNVDGTKARKESSADLLTHYVRLGGLSKLSEYTVPFNISVAFNKTEAQNQVLSHEVRYSVVNRDGTITYQEDSLVIEQNPRPYHPDYSRISLDYQELTQRDEEDRVELGVYNTTRNLVSSRNDIRYRVRLDYPENYVYDREAIPRENTSTWVVVNFSDNLRSNRPSNPQSTSYSYIEDDQIPKDDRIFLEVEMRDPEGQVKTGEDGLPIRAKLESDAYWHKVSDVVATNVYTNNVAMVDERRSNYLDQDNYTTAEIHSSFFVSNGNSDPQSPIYIHQIDFTRNMGADNQTLFNPSALTVYGVETSYQVYGVDGDQETLLTDPSQEMKNYSAYRLKFDQPVSFLRGQLNPQVTFISNLKEDLTGSDEDLRRIHRSDEHFQVTVSYSGGLEGSLNTLTESSKPARFIYRLPAKTSMDIRGSSRGYVGNELLANVDIKQEVEGKNIEGVDADYINYQNLKLTIQTPRGLSLADDNIVRYLSESESKQDESGTTYVFDFPNPVNGNTIEHYLEENSITFIANKEAYENADGALEVELPVKFTLTYEQGPYNSNSQATATHTFTVTTSTGITVNLENSKTLDGIYDKATLNLLPKDTYYARTAIINHAAEPMSNRGVVVALPRVGQKNLNRDDQATQVNGYLSDFVTDPDYHITYTIDPIGRGSLQEINFVEAGEITDINQVTAVKYMMKSGTFIEGFQTDYVYTPIRVDEAGTPSQILEVSAGLITRDNQIIQSGRLTDRLGIPRLDVFLNYKHEGSTLLNDSEPFGLHVRYRITRENGQLEEYSSRDSWGDPNSGHFKLGEDSGTQFVASSEFHDSYSPIKSIEVIGIENHLGAPVNADKFTWTVDYHPQAFLDQLSQRAKLNVTSHHEEQKGDFQFKYVIELSDGRLADFPDIWNAQEIIDDINRQAYTLSTQLTHLMGNLDSRVVTSAQDAATIYAEIIRPFSSLLQNSLSSSHEINFEAMGLSQNYVDSYIQLYGYDDYSEFLRDLSRYGFIPTHIPHPTRTDIEKEQPWYGLTEDYQLFDLQDPDRTPLFDFGPLKDYYTRTQRLNASTTSILRSHNIQTYGDLYEALGEEIYNDLVKQNKLPAMSDEVFEHVFDRVIVAKGVRSMDGNIPSLQGRHNLLDGEHMSIEYEIDFHPTHLAYLAPIVEVESQRLIGLYDLQAQKPVDLFEQKGAEIQTFFDYFDLELNDLIQTSPIDNPNYQNPGNFYISGFDGVFVPGGDDKGRYAYVTSLSQLHHELFDGDGADFNDPRRKSLREKMDIASQYTNGNFTLDIEDIEMYPQEYYLNIGRVINQIKEAPPARTDSFIYTFAHLDTKTNQVQMADAYGARYYGPLEMIFVTNLVNKITESEAKIVPFETEYQVNNNLPEGVVNVIQEGEDGLNEILVETLYETDPETGAVVILEVNRYPETVVRPAIPRILEIGTGTVTVTESEEKREVVIPFNEIRVPNPYLEQGKERVIQEGQNGSQVEVYKVSTLGDREVGRSLDRVENIIPPVDKIVEYGTGTFEISRQTEVVPFETIYQDNPNWPVGEEREIQAGIEGEKLVTTRTPLENGNPSGQPIVTEEIIKQAQDRIIERGVGVLDKLIEEEKISIPFETIYRDNPELPKGQEREIQPGVEGLRVITKTTPTLNGQRYGETVTSEELVTNPQDRIVERGTGEEVDIDKWESGRRTDSRVEEKISKQAQDGMIERRPAKAETSDKVADTLPQTGDASNLSFIVASASAVLMGLGLISPRKSKKDQ